jgi:sugar-specific transcriptional regulator TrmB
MDIKETLKDIGFQDNEIVIYLFLLKRGSSSQQIISDEGGILRQTVYDVMKKMENKGYVTSSLVGKRKFYNAVEPEFILGQIKVKEEQFLQILPNLMSMKNNNQINLTSQIFFGVNGLRNLFDLTLSSDSEILWLCNREISDDLFQEFYWHNYSKKRIEKDIPIKLLFEPDNKKDWDTNKKEKRETRKSKFVNGLASSFVLFDDKILIYSMEEGQLQGVLIQNSVTKEMFSKIFDLLWNSSE